MKKAILLAAILAVPSIAVADEPRAKGFGIRTAIDASDHSVQGTPPRFIRNGHVLVRPGLGKRTVRRIRR